MVFGITPGVPFGFIPDSAFGFAGIPMVVVQSSRPLLDVAPAGPISSPLYCGGRNVANPRSEPRNDVDFRISEAAGLSAFA
jgi:hypothetical protein